VTGDSQQIRLLSAVPQFSVSDIVLTTEYYRDVLGFLIAGYWDGANVTDAPGRSPLFAIVQRDNVEIFFNQSRGGDIRTGRTEGAYDVYLNVNGVDALAEELRSRGAEIVEGPLDRVYGRRELVVRDCNDLILTFSEAASGGGA
jgi:uncharacterized glyoxalase superfamily protein PhnB